MFTFPKGRSKKSSHAFCMRPYLLETGLPSLRGWMYALNVLKIQLNNEKHNLFVLVMWIHFYWYAICQVVGIRRSLAVVWKLQHLVLSCLLKTRSRDFLLVTFPRHTHLLCVDVNKGPSKLTSSSSSLLVSELTIGA